MAVIRCGNGHYYDDEKFTKCPHCGIFADINTDVKAYNKGDGQNTVSYTNAGSSLRQELEKTIAMKDLVETAGDDEKTIGYYSKSRGNDYVTGWLVCMKGPERGRDYRLSHGFNWIGRDYTMDVCIVDDQSISRKKHCAVVYDDRGEKFSLVPAGGNLVYMGNAAVTGPVEIKTGDVIEIGKSSFEFVAFCRGEHKWEKEQ